jgi:hypothetical protein
MESLKYDTFRCGHDRSVENDMGDRCRICFNAKRRLRRAAATEEEHAKTKEKNAAAYQAQREARLAYQAMYYKRNRKEILRKKAERKSLNGHTTKPPEDSPYEPGSLADIAFHFGVSKALCSYAINGKRGVSEALRVAIIDYRNKRLAGEA